MYLVSFAIFSFLFLLMIPTEKAHSILNLMCHLFCETSAIALICICKG